MNKLPKDKRDKIILAAIITVALTAAIWLLLISPQRQTPCAPRSRNPMSNWPAATQH